MNKRMKKKMANQVGEVKTVDAAAKDSQKKVRNQHATVIEEEPVHVKCIHCGNADSTVISSYMTGDGARVRQRRCPACGYVFNSVYRKRPPQN